MEHFWQAYDGKEALEFIEHHSVDLLLLDVELPHLRGNELLKRVQKRRKNLPVIVISGHATKEDLIDLINYKVCAFMQKPINLEDLIRTINKVLDNKAQQRKLELLASTDPMTKLLNKHVIRDLFTEWKTYKSRFLMIVIDLDDFKTINDTYGHAMGDRVLQAFGEKLRSTFRSSDVIYRFGRDEFLLFVEANDPEEIERKLQRRSGIEKKALMHKALPLDLFEFFDIAL